MRSIEEWTSDYKSWYHLMDSTNTALTCVTNGQRGRCDYKYPPRSDQQCPPLYPSVPQCTPVYPGTGHNPLSCFDSRTPAVRRVILMSRADISLKTNNNRRFVQKCNFWAICTAWVSSVIEPSIYYWASVTVDTLSIILFLQVHCIRGHGLLIQKVDLAIIFITITILFQYGQQCLGLGKNLLTSVATSGIIFCFWFFSVLHEYWSGAHRMLKCSCSLPL